MAIHQTIKKLKERNMFDNAYLENVLLKSKIKTQVITPNGIMVMSELTILNVNPALPSKVRWV